MRVRGRVQGVGFRYDARARARSLGLDGWIRNNPDGTVEGAFEGEESRVDLAVSWCRRGPSAARVDEIDVEWEEPQGTVGFSVL